MLSHTIAGGGSYVLRLRQQFACICIICHHALMQQTTHIINIKPNNRSPYAYLHIIYKGEVSVLRDNWFDICTAAKTGE